MTTFADLMSLLLCFFVLLLSFSEMDKKKFKRIAGSMQNAFGVQKDIKVMGSPEGTVIIAKGFETVPLQIQLRKKIDIIVEETMDQSMTEIEVSPEDVTLRVKDSMAFDFGKAEIKPEFKLFLDKLGNLMIQNDVHLTIEGHTDNVPLGKDAPFESNWDLSTARAVEVVEYLRNKFGLPSKRLTAVGHAEGKPLVENTTPENRARNRRVEFKLKPGKSGQVFNGIELIQ